MNRVRNWVGDQLRISCCEDSHFFVIFFFLPFHYVIASICQFWKHVYFFFFVREKSPKLIVNFLRCNMNSKLYSRKKVSKVKSRAETHLSQTRITRPWPKQTLQWDALTNVPFISIFEKKTDPHWFSVLFKRLLMSKLVAITISRSLKRPQKQ